MSLSNASAANNLTLAAAAVPAALTMMGWFYFATIPAAIAVLMEFSTSTGDYDLEVAAAGGILNVWNGATTNATGFTITAGKWVHLTWVSSAFGTTSQEQVFANGLPGTLISVASGNIAAGTTPTYRFNFDIGGAEPLPATARYSNIKIWKVALAAAQIKQEYLSYAPINIKNLVCWWPNQHHRLAGRDFSGLKNHATVAGAFTTAPEPTFLQKSPRKRHRLAYSHTFDSKKNNIINTAI